ncbi:MAG: bifunctional phosphoglucose/phosphomannose isomerase [Candidatus Odinarchaeota archaeon]
MTNTINFKQSKSKNRNMRKLPETMNLDDMRSMVSHFPDMLRNPTPDPDIIGICRDYHRDGIDGLCFLGMGGSLIVGSYVKEILSQESHIPIDIVKTYFLPKWVSKDWIVVAISYSGNTEETLTSLRHAKERGSRILTITSGGQMAKEYGRYPQVIIGKGAQPRAAFPVLLSEVLPISESLVGVKITNLVKVSENLISASKTWGESISTPSVIAQKIHNRIPLFIGAQHMSPVAYRAKCQINENSKAEAFYSEIPEATHNEIEGFPYNEKDSIIPVFLRCFGEDSQISRRMDITFNLYKEIGLNPIPLNSIGESKIDNMLSLTHYLDMVSVELADKRGVNAVSVTRIGELKKRLASKG